MSKPGIFVQLPDKDKTAYICCACKRKAVYDGLMDRKDISSPTSFATPPCSCYGTIENIILVTRDPKFQPINMNLPDAIQESPSAISLVKSTNHIKSIDLVKLTADCSETIGGTTLKVTSIAPPAIYIWLRGALDGNNYAKEVTSKVNSLPPELLEKAFKQWLGITSRVSNPSTSNLIYALAVKDSWKKFTSVRDYFNVGMNSHTRFANRDIISRLWKNREVILESLSGEQAFVRTINTIKGLPVDTEIKVPSIYYRVDAELLYILSQVTKDKDAIEAVVKNVPSDGGQIGRLISTTPSYLRKASIGLMMFAATKLNPDQLVRFLSSYSETGNALVDTKTFNDITNSPTLLKCLELIGPIGSPDRPYVELISHLNKIAKDR